ncbi:Nudix family hydrolase [Lasiodiplodia theobromae]|uniref:Nudix family hydrolase n=1 Tax=Lasiodiplodia theobromae TaxID=45133 RepID=UPI0015C3B550|nr:Nudix family hydrolase [Lasiodiplodia theobromae]KAF4537750.1 Nudix family hydrolase [Lasiodiplodia theobromae]
MSTSVTFNLNEPSTAPVPVTLVEGLSEDQLRGFAAFQHWYKTLQASLKNQENEKHAFHDKPYSLRSIKIKSVSFFGERIGFLKFEAKITNAADEELPGVVLLRGPSVAMLMILRPHDNKSERLVIMTEQPRVPAGSLAFLEIPAGMMDDGTETFAGAAAREIKEETGLTVRRNELKDLTALALDKVENHTGEHLQNAMYPSPGGCDEYIALFLWEKVLNRQSIEKIKGRLSGLRSQGEMVRIRLIPYEDLWSHGARDAKTLAAWALYESLKRSGHLNDVR